MLQMYGFMWNMKIYREVYFSWRMSDIFFTILLLLQQGLLHALEYLKPTIALILDQNQNIS